jgi:protein SCO1/2
MKTGRAARRRQRDRNALTLAGGGVAGLLLLAGASSWLMAPSAVPQRGVGGAFTLVADTGHIVTERSFPGKYLAIYFGYTNCQDVCPATMTNLSAALARLGQTAEQIQPLFITVDPQRDSPDQLHRFVTNFSPKLVGLTGTETELRRVGAEFHVASNAHRTTAEPAAYAVDHSSVIYLFAPDGSFMAPIPADASEMVMAQAMARYVKKTVPRA